MDWIDLVLSPFEWTRARLEGAGGPGYIFVLSLVGYAILLVSVAVVAHVLTRKAANLTRWYAQRLVRGAELSDVVRLESSSARIESALRWLGTRVVRSSYGTSEQTTRIPREGGDRTSVHAVRWMLRSLWLLLRGISMFIFGLPNFLLTTFGTSVLLFAFCTAFPDDIRDAVNAAGAFLADTSWSEASAIKAVTVGAATITVTVVITKVMVSEPARARRSFRRQRNAAALEQLHRAETAIATLAYALHEQMHEMVRAFSIEKCHAQEWFDWTQRSSSDSDTWRGQSGDHLRCSRECLSPKLGTKTQRTYASNLQAAISSVEAAWKGGLNENTAILTGLISRRARRGLLGFNWWMSTSGEFLIYRLPSLDEWQKRRVRWQHSHLRHSALSESDIAAGRPVAIRASAPPDKRWLEEELVQILWDMAELYRELSDLADYAHSMSRPRRFEQVIRATE